MAKKVDKGLSPLWFVGGIAAGVGLWLYFTNKLGPPQTASVAPAKPALPVVSTPARYADLRSVLARFDQVMALYNRGSMSSPLALAESEGLIAAANSFSLAEGEAASEAVGRIMAFTDKVRTDMALRTIPSGMAGIKKAVGFSARSLWN